MKRFLSKILAITAILLVILAGIFCYQGLQTMNAHCSENTDSFWCSDFLSHGTIISDATIPILFTILSILVVLISIKPIIALFAFATLKQVVRHTPKIRGNIPILSPIQLAISNGLIHPRIP